MKLSTNQKFIPTAAAVSVPPPTAHCGPNPGRRPPPPPPPSARPTRAARMSSGDMEHPASLAPPPTTDQWGARSDSNPQPMASEATPPSG